MYYSQSQDVTAAISHWKRALEQDPKHLLSLLSMGEELLHEHKAADALPYLKRAVEAEPTAWRAQAFLADAELRQGATDEAIQHAERALELGHGKAQGLARRKILPGLGFAAIRIVRGLREGDNAVQEADQILPGQVVGEQRRRGKDRLCSCHEDGKGKD